MAKQTRPSEKEYCGTAALLECLGRAGEALAPIWTMPGKDRRLAAEKLRQVADYIESDRGKSPNEKAEARREQPMTMNTPKTQLPSEPAVASSDWLDRRLGIHKLKSDPLGPLAIELARCCSPENGPELNALRMLDVLRRSNE